MTSTTENGPADGGATFDPSKVASDRDAHMWRWRLHWHDKDQWFPVMSLSQFKMLLGANIYQVRHVGSSGVHDCVGTTTYTQPPATPAEATATTARQEGKREGLLRAAEIVEERAQTEDAEGNAGEIWCLHNAERAIRAEAQAPAPTSPSQAGEDDLAAMRADGWAVAVHNDYLLAGKRCTFWLLTHPNGWWVKGEGASDSEALALARLGATRPAPPAGDVEARIAAEREECALIADDLAVVYFADFQRGVRAAGSMRTVALIIGERIRARSAQPDQGAGVTAGETQA